MSYHSRQVGQQTVRRPRKERLDTVIDYRLFYPEISIIDDRRAQRLNARRDARIYRLPARRPLRFGGRR